MNKTPIARRAAIVRSRCEGTSIRATARLTGTAKAPVLRLLVELGEFCSIYQDHAHQNLSTKRVEADELWAYLGARAKNATKGGQGDIWTYTAIDVDSKLMLSWLVGARNSANTKAVMADVAERMGGRIQLTTDGLPWYLRAVEDFNLVRRAAEPQHPDAAAQVHSAHERLQQEGREPRARLFDVRDVLQLLPRAPDAHEGGERDQDNARDGERLDRSRLDGRRYFGEDGPEKAVTIKPTQYRRLGAR